MSNVNVQRVRDRAWGYLSPEVAASAGMSLQQLQRFIGGSFTPSQQQLELLAKRMGVDHD